MPVLLFVEKVWYHKLRTILLQHFVPVVPKASDTLSAHGRPTAAGESLNFVFGGFVVQQESFLLVYLSHCHKIEGPIAVDSQANVRVARVVYQDGRNIHQNVTIPINLQCVGILL